jgi:hypothetical protein
MAEADLGRVADPEFLGLSISKRQEQAKALAEFEAHSNALARESPGPRRYSTAITGGSNHPYGLVRWFIA